MLKRTQTSPVHPTRYSLHNRQQRKHDQSCPLQQQKMTSRFQDTLAQVALDNYFGDSDSDFKKKLEVVQEFVAALDQLEQNNAKPSRALLTAHPDLRTLYDELSFGYVEQNLKPELRKWLEQTASVGEEDRGQEMTALSLTPTPSTSFAKQQNVEYFNPELLGLVPSTLRSSMVEPPVTTRVRTGAGAGSQRAVTQQRPVTRRTPEESLQDALANMDLFGGSEGLLETKEELPYASNVDFVDQELLARSMRPVTGQRASAGAGAFIDQELLARSLRPVTARPASSRSEAFIDQELLARSLRPVTARPASARSEAFIDQELLARSLRPVTAVPSARAPGSTRTSRVASTRTYAPRTRVRTATAAAAPTEIFEPVVAAAPRTSTSRSQVSSVPRSYAGAGVGAGAGAPSATTMRETVAALAAASATRSLKSTSQKGGFAGSSRSSRSGRSARTGTSRSRSQSQSRSVSRSRSASRPAGADWWEYVCISGGPTRQSFRDATGGVITQEDIPSVLSQAGILGKHPCTRDASVIVIPDSADTASNTQIKKAGEGARIMRWSDFVDAIPQEKGDILRDLTQVLDTDVRKPAI
jgi:hypothetical protein